MKISNWMTLIFDHQFFLWKFSKRLINDDCFSLCSRRNDEFKIDHNEKIVFSLQISTSIRSTSKRIIDLTFFLGRKEIFISKFGSPSFPSAIETIFIIKIQIYFRQKQIHEWKTKDLVSFSDKLKEEKHFERTKRKTTNFLPSNFFGSFLKNFNEKKINIPWRKSEVQRTGGAWRFFRHSSTTIDWNFFRWPMEIAVSPFWKGDFRFFFGFSWIFDYVEEIRQEFNSSKNSQLSGTCWKTFFRTVGISIEMFCFGSRKMFLWICHFE